jgi:hypothetical protein
MLTKKKNKNTIGTIINKKKLRTARKINDKRTGTSLQWSLYRSTREQKELRLRPCVGLFFSVLFAFSPYPRRFLCMGLRGRNMVRSTPVDSRRLPHIFLILRSRKIFFFFVFFFYFFFSVIRTDRRLQKVKYLPTIHSFIVWLAWCWLQKNKIKNKRK